MEVYQIVLLLITGLALLYCYSYMIVRACSTAYFKSKLDYQHTFFRKFDPNHPVGDK